MNQLSVDEFKRTWATYAIIIVCVLIPTTSTAHFFGPLGQVTNALAYMPAAALYQPWRLVGGGFVHVGRLHLLFNMLTLWLAGRQLEELLGHWRFLFLWLVCTTGAYVFDLLLTVYVQTSNLMGVTVGASGGIFALFAVILVLERRAGADVGGLAIMILVSMGYSFAVSGISWQVHLGGLIVGALVGLGIHASTKAGGQITAGVFDYYAVADQRRQIQARRIRAQYFVLALTALIEVALWVLMRLTATV